MDVSVRLTVDVVLQSHPDYTGHMQDFMDASQGNQLWSEQRIKVESQRTAFTFKTRVNMKSEKEIKATTSFCVIAYN